MQPSLQRRRVMTGVLLALCTGSALAFDAGRQQRIEARLTELLFDLDADEFTAYRFVTGSGRLEITFASNTPRDMAKDILVRIRALPEVTSARENFGGPTCGRF